MSERRAPSPWAPSTSAISPAAREPARLGHAMLAVTSGAVGLVGALLPAMAGQQVGDPDTAVFWIGVALGATGAVAAATLATRELGRDQRLAATAAAIAALVIAGLAGLMTLALLFSG